jgi:uncharacterized protein (TIGR03437 family)
MRIDHATLLLRPDPGLSLFLASQQMPGSPDYRRTLTPEQFGERFGLSANDLAKVVAWLESQGMKVDDVARGRHWITFSGTAAQASRTFGTAFHRYLAEGRMHFANTGDPIIPAALEPVIGGFTGLNDFASHISRPHPQSNLSDGSHAIAPDDLATIYNVAPLYAAGIDGTGQTIVIAGEVNLNLADIRSFRTTFNLPANDPTVVLVGRDPGPNEDALVEADLDVEWSGAIAPKAKIVYVYASDPFTAARYAIDQNLGQVISISFGACEAFATISYRAIVQQANAQGITVLVASGDLGGAVCDHTAPVPQAAKGARAGFPAGIPEITAVGGTMFNEGTSNFWGASTPNHASALSYIPEVAWNETPVLNALLTSGGGPSRYFAKPFWQAGPGVPDDKQRDTPDISLTAAIAHDPYLVISGGSLFGVGGTSAASPSLAGIVALLNQSLVNRKVIAQPGVGNINPTLYRLAQSAKDAFHDITSGDTYVPCLQGSPDCVNGSLGYPAGPGYDMATGLGSIDAARLVAAWGSGDASTTTLAADLAKAGIADTVTLTATVKGSGAVPTGAVTFVTSLDASLGSVTLAAAAGSATAKLTVPAQSVLGGDGKVYALYSGDAVYAPSAGLVTVAPVLPAAGSFVVATLTPNPTSVLAITGQAPVTIVFSEKAGVATKLTSATIGNSSINLNTFFGGGAIPANGTLTSATIAIVPALTPIDFSFHFVGQDADGTTWTRDLSLHVVDSPGPSLVPGITLTSSPSTVAQNPNADPSCQWSHTLTLHETGGYYVTLTDSGNSVLQLFGTTRLAPYGTLTGTVCLGATGGSAPANRSYQFVGTSEIGLVVAATVRVTYTTPAATPAVLAVSAKSLNLGVSDAGQTATANLDLSFTGGSPQWTAAALPVKPTWLTFTPSSGTAAGRVVLTADAAGLSKGVYNTTLVIDAPGSLPATMSVPVTFVVGQSSRTLIGGVLHGASFKTAFAPGMILSVFGSNLAPATVIAGAVPLPLSLAGVSATVNGVTAPLYFVSPGQLNVQVPFETGQGLAVLAVNNNGQVASLPFQVAVTAPGIFVQDGTLVPFAQAKAGDTLLAFITGDGDQTPTIATGDTPAATTALSRLPKSRLPVSITVGGVPATIVFNGIPNGLAGVTQINFTMPPGVPPGPQNVVVTVGGVATPPAKITAQ